MSQRNPPVTWDERAVSCLIRARQTLEDLAAARSAGHQRSKMISQAQRVSEYALKAILYKRRIRVGKTHRLDQIAMDRKGTLIDLWSTLAPLLEAYSTLWTDRQMADYRHADVPPMDDFPGVASPPLSDRQVDRALRTAHGLRELAESVVLPGGGP
ncbi:MAG: HEPN domain-containing protein [Thermoanaerobaculia bacterium]|nr:HEPN domain-containing protein [Thermoanaerobaculia bacterium]